MGEDHLVTSISCDSRRIRDGDLFVALPGTQSNGVDFVHDALKHGANAVCVSREAARDLEHLGVTLIIVDDPRHALAQLAAHFHAHPERAIPLVGVTGTLGKTSVVLLLEAALAASSETRNVGVVGSLGAHIRGPAAHEAVAAELPDLDGMTTPDAPTLFGALHTMVKSGVDIVAMEVTSHALAQERINGLQFALGVFTNLVPDEHLEYHGTSEHYLATKARYFDHLAPGAPIVIKGEDLLLERMVHDAIARENRPVVRVSLGSLSPRASARLRSNECDVTVDRARTDVGGAAFVLRINRPLPMVGCPDRSVMPTEIPIVLPVLGVQQVANAALAATAALMCGATTRGITESLAEVEPIARRMHVVRAERPLVIDDTTGNPESLRAVFATVSDLPRGCLRVLFGVRGMRGTEINRRLADTLGRLLLVESRRTPVDLVVTASRDLADERNRPQAQEVEALLDALIRRGIRYEFEPELREATAHLARVTQPDDLVLLLGAQGMNDAAKLLADALELQSTLHVEQQV